MCSLPAVSYTHLTTNNTDTTGTTPQATAQEDTLVLVRVTKTGTLINGCLLYTSRCV